MRRLVSSGAHIHIPRADQDYAVEVGLRMLLLRHFVEEENGLYRANPREEILLRYYANAIAHLIPDRTTLAAPAAAE
jgi:glycerol-3-phosphate O-acyltransferase